MPFILASQSKYRRELLTRAGFDFRCESPAVDEDELKKTAPADVEEMTRFLALKKAESLMERFPDQWIVGCDQAAAAGKRILNKPGTRERAAQQLKFLSGRWHRLVTSMAIVKSGEIPTVMTDVTRIKIRQLTHADIETYLDRDDPIDCAASYKIEASGICIVEDMRCKDPSAIEGISIIALTSFFIRHGFPLAEILTIP